MKQKLWSCCDLLSLVPTPERFRGAVEESFGVKSAENGNRDSP